MNKTDEQLVVKASEKLRGFIKSKENEVHLHCNLGKILEDYGMSQKDLIRLTGLPQNQVSAFVTNRSGVKLGYHHILAIAEAFDIDDLSEILELRRKV